MSEKEESEREKGRDGDGREKASAERERREDRRRPTSSKEDREREREREQSAYDSEDETKNSLMNTIFGASDPNQNCKEDLLQLVDLLITHKYGSIFAAPVSKEEADDYDEVVRVRVDLSTLREKILQGEVRTILQFYWHILLMFQNAFIYNAPGSDIVTLTQTMKRFAVKEIEAVLMSRSAGNQWVLSSPAPPSPETPLRLSGRMRKSGDK